MMDKKIFLKHSLYGLLISLIAFGCSKVEYRNIEEPTYLRVFNTLDYVVDINTKDQPAPFLTFLIDPQFDAEGTPTGAAFVGDFLDKRLNYAAPYPTYTGNASSRSYEFPGNADVLVGPILNGYDLSGWAQIPSGQRRVMFFYRPISEVPFFNLESRLRKNILLDTVISLEPREVYTLNVVQRDFNTKENGLYIRKENFYKQALSDSLVYVNFYNLSAKGYWSADDILKPDVGQVSLNKNGFLAEGVKDTLNVYYTLYKQTEEWQDASNQLKGYINQFMTTIYRNTQSGNAEPYFSFPLWADRDANGIRTGMWERIMMCVPGMEPQPASFGTGSLSDPHKNYVWMSCIGNGQVKPPLEYTSVLFPNMVVSIHSGNDNPRSFATVNTIEVINGNAYLTTVQRKFAPPIYPK